jgi:hypothetical protein
MDMKDGMVIDPAEFERMVEWEERMHEELGTNLNEARAWIFENCGSSEKMSAIMYLDWEMRFPDWLTLLGEVWSCCDNIGLYRDDLVSVIKEWLDQPLTIIPELMDPDERTAFEALPDEITIYRGCGPRNKHGLSWTLRRDVAVRFPFSMRYWSDTPTILTATISKTRAAALKLERNEEEIIVVDLPESCWTEELITEPPPLR